MIGQAHIDPVWLWPWTEGISVVFSTFRSALDRMNETPGFAFTAAQLSSINGLLKTILPCLPRSENVLMKVAGI